MDRDTQTALITEAMKLRKAQLETKVMKPSEADPLAMSKILEAFGNPATAQDLPRQTLEFDFHDNVIGALSEYLNAKSKNADAVPGPYLNMIDHAIMPHSLAAQQVKPGNTGLGA